MDTPPTICFFQSSRFDSVASLMAAHLGNSAQLIEMDDLEGEPDYRAILEALFQTRSPQSW